MHLVLVREGYQAIHVPDVTLSEGHRLSVGGVEADTPDVEPAQWFKTLVMDYMTIDCSKRTVKWSMEDSEPSLKKSSSQQQNHNSRALFSAGEFSDFETQSDELFESITKVFEQHGQTTLTDISPLLLRMLHCHILPNVNLNQDDIPKLEEVMAKQQHLITNLEERVDELSKENSLHNSVLRNYRNKMVDDLHKNPDDAVNYGSEILPLLKEHVSRDCQRIGENLQQLENAVVRAKEEVERCPDEEQLRCDLNQKRATRNTFYEERYLKVVSVREALSEQLVACQKSATLPASFPKPRRHHMKVLTKKHKSLKVKADKIRLIHDLYVKTSEMKAHTKDEIKNLMTRKVLMVSVKEAIAMTIRDLQSKEHTVGLQTRRGHSCMYPTDVLNRATLPSDWLTFEDRMTEMVNDESHEVGTMHTAFCQLVATTCDEAFQEDACYRTSPEKHQELQDVARTAGLLCNSETSEGKDCCDMDAPPARKAIDRLKSMIAKHFEEICPIIQDHLQASSIDKTRIAYETYFYDAVNKCLIPLYESAYSDCTTTLKTQAGCLTVNDLEIEEAWILDMLETRRDSGIEMENEMECAKPKMHLASANQMTSEFEKLTATYKFMIDISCDSLPGAESDDESHRLVMDESGGVTGGTNCSFGQSLDDVSKSQGNVTGNSDGEIAVDGTNRFVAELPEQEIPCDHCKHELYSSSEKSTTSCMSSDDPHSTSDQCNCEFYTSGDKSIASEEGNNGVHISGDRPEPEAESVASVDLLKPREFIVQSDKFKHVFDTAYHCLISLGNENTPLKKMQMLARCLRFITTTLAKLETTGRQSSVCSDDLVTILVVLLLNLTPDQISHLYIELKFIYDFMAPFLETGVHCYSVVQIEVAYQYIFTKLMMIKNRKT